MIDNSVRKNANTDGDESSPPKTEFVQK